MTRIARLKQLLNQNIVARLVLYAAALLMPVVAYCELNKDIYLIIEEIGFYNVMWVGFYSCILLFWACNEKLWNWIINIVLVLLNMMPMVLLLFGAYFVGGFQGIFGVVATTVVPFFNFFGGFFWSMMN